MAQDGKIQIARRKHFFHTFNDDLAEQPDTTVKIEFGIHHHFEWSLLIVPVPGDCYELRLNAECALSDAPENLKNHLEGTYDIRLKKDLFGEKEYPRYSGQLISGSIVITRELPKKVLQKEVNNIWLKMDIERVLGSDEKKPEPKVKLDIGGMQFHTTPSTICRYFSRLKRDAGFLVKWDSDKQNSHSCIDFDVQGRYWKDLFYDRDPKHFSYILNFLREGYDMELPKNQDDIKEISKEAKFWMLKELEEMCEWRLKTSDF